MKKPLILLIGTILSLTTLSISVYAHPGKTDGAGGHYDHQNGGYHYHHGYPAHSHTNGECPYNFDDKTNHTPSNNNSNNSSSKDVPTASHKAKAKTSVWKNIVGIGFAILVCSPLILPFLFFIYYRILSPVVEFLKNKFK